MISDERGGGGSGSYYGASEQRVKFAYTHVLQNLNMGGGRVQKFKFSSEFIFEWPLSLNKFLISDRSQTQLL